MSRKKALSINFPIERVVLSDVLPYEVPIVFSNRYFYRFLCDHAIKFHENRISWNHIDEVLDNLVKMVLGIQPNKPVRHVTEDCKTVSIVDLDKTDIVHTVPFIFSTTHKQDQLRQLSLMHPKGQLLVVDFYDQFKDWRRQKLSATPDLSGTVLPCLTTNSALKSAPTSRSVCCAA